LQTIKLSVPASSPKKTFLNVLTRRRSKLGKQCSPTELGPLLWHACRVHRTWPSGRANIPWQWRAAPSGGGLHPIEVVCIPSKSSDRVSIYDPVAHSLQIIACSSGLVVQRNARDLQKIFGVSRGTTLQLVADLSKMEAAYDNPMSIVWRDAGCLISIICLCAEWLSYSCCPIGRVGTSLLSDLGLPSDRYVAVGGLLVGS